MSFSMKKWLLRVFIFLYLFPVCLLLNVKSGSARDLKVAYINSQRILDESKKGKDATKDLKKIEDEKKEEIERKKKEIEDLEAELRKKEFAITPERKREIEEEIRHKALELKFFEEVKDKEIKEKYYKSLKKIESEIMDIVLKLGQDEDFDLILGREESGILFANPKYDITDKVIQIYDKQNE